MKAMRRILLAILIIAATAAPCRAQYYQMINQGTQLINTALQGGFYYRGFVEGSYLNGVGNNRASFLEISTTQGFKKADWFYMGIGAGIDVVFANCNVAQDQINGKNTTQTGVMLPLFTDFRFNIGGQSVTSAFVDVRVGASFLVGSNYLQVGDSYIDRSQCFYFKPSIGVRIPVDANNSNHAFNVAASYMLVNTGYWNYDTINLSAVGLTIGYEW